MSSSVSVKFRWGLTASNPEQTPVLVVGQVPHLNAIAWGDVKNKLEPCVTEEAWRRGLSCVTQSAGEWCEMWPRAAVLASLPARRSRHAAPSRAHALAKIIRNNQRTTDEFIVLVCRKRDVYASSLAIARSFPLYSARSTSTPLVVGGTQPYKPRTVWVEVHLVPEDKCDGDSEDENQSTLDPVLTDGTLSDEDLAVIQNAADGVRLAASIADTPANIMTVDKVIEISMKVASELDIEPPTIIRGEELKARGMGGIYGVGAGAKCPPALIVLSRKVSPTAHNLAFVGKGIVFDTGGLCIKSRANMLSMKNDCAGAAGILSAFSVLVRANATLNLHAVLCMAENAVGPNATRPDDVHQLYSGRTVEINNTDAEGRLVLGDGVVYAARDLKADTIVDMATLTGAQGIATGKYHAAIISNCARLETQCVLAGKRSADLAHGMPYAPELHFNEFSSVVADMKNSVADRYNAQPSCAGLFILAHLGFDFPGAWLHIDMASPAICNERATGYGVGLLTVLFGAHTENKLLRALSPGPAALLTNSRE